MKLKIVSDEEFRKLEIELSSRVWYATAIFKDIEIEGIGRQSRLDPQITTCPTLINAALEKYESNNKK